MYNKACTELYAVPYAKTEITVPETVKKVTFPEENQIQSLTFQSAEPPEIELRRLDHAKIYVPDDAYLAQTSSFPRATRIPRISIPRMTPFC